MWSFENSPGEKHSLCRFSALFNFFFFQCIARLSYLPAGGSTVLLKWDNNGTCRIGSDFKASGSIYCCLEKQSIFFSVQCLNQIPNALSGVYLNKNWFKISEYVFF